MMRYIINDNYDVIELMSNGNMRTMLTEISILINGLYCAMAKGDEEAAEAFKHGMLDAVMPTSPVWDKHDVDCISIVQRKSGEQT